LIGDKSGVVWWWKWGEGTFCSLQWEKVEWTAFLWDKILNNSYSTTTDRNPTNV